VFSLISLLVGSVASLPRPYLPRTKLCFGAGFYLPRSAPPFYERAGLLLGYSKMGVLKVKRVKDSLKIHYPKLALSWHSRMPSFLERKIAQRWAFIIKFPSTST